MKIDLLHLLLVYREDRFAPLALGVFVNFELIQFSDKHTNSTIEKKVLKEYCVYMCVFRFAGSSHSPTSSSQHS